MHTKMAIFLLLVRSFSMTCGTKLQQTCGTGKPSRRRLHSEFLELKALACWRPLLLHGFLKPSTVNTGHYFFRHGVRNSLLLAPMPTASTAQILGNNESIEPYTSNIYTRRVLSGEFQVGSLLDHHQHYLSPVQVAVFCHFRETLSLQEALHCWAVLYCKFPPCRFLQQMVNPHLLKDLTERSLWNDDMKNQLIANNGSVQVMKRQCPSSSRSHVGPRPAV